MSEIMPFGKYKGIDIDDVAEADPQYIVWLADNTDIDILPESMVEDCREGAQAYEADKEDDLHFGLDGW